VSAALNLRKEHVVFGGTVALLALLYFTSAGPTPARASRGGSGSAPTFEDHPAPNVDIALPRKRAFDSFDRDVFSPPSDTRPLPPLDMESPPLPRLSALRPPPIPALDPKLFGKLLRADATPTPVSGLFFSEENAGEAESEIEELSGGASDSTLALLQAAASGKKEIIESAEERAARMESYKKLYDWLRLGETELLFGQIRNPDRYGLRGRAADAVLFVQVDPETGKEKFPGQKPVAYQRDRIAEFAFADTPTNRIGLRKHEFTGTIGPSQYANMLALADDCIDMRLEARDALATAEELYTKAAAFDPQDPTPQLGLARCYEAGFQFEKAFDVYTRLLETFEHRPEVHIGLGELEARLRLFDSARERFRYADEHGGRTSWRVQWAFGRFLFERGEYAEAATRLRVAYEQEPREPSEATTRSAIRRDYAAALLATGAIDEAATTFDRALQAEPGEPRARGGKLEAQRLSKSGSPTLDAEQTSNFELLVARGLVDLDAKNWQPARDALVVAAGAAPLRAPVAWRSVSWLAELTGNSEDAVRWIERAREGDPTDAWTLYQHGRLLAARDDAAAAKEAFLAALDQELDFVDALVSLGELSYRGGDYASAERYLERALSLDAKRAEVHALRGINQIELNDLDAARESFERALALDAMQPLARAGQAWTTYRGGDSQRAITQFAELNDVRRSLPETDPYRVYAKAQMERIGEHESKFEWIDNFERLQLKNGWDSEESAGPIVTLVDGAMVLEGVFTQNGSARVYQTYNAAEFVSMELDITISTDCNAKVGVFIAKERRGGAGQATVSSKLGIARRRDGGLVVLVMDTATADENWEDVPALGVEPWWPLGRPVRLRIEKVGEGNQSYGRLLVDGVPVREGFKIPRLAAPSNDVKVGVFVEGQTGLPAKITVDNVDVIKRVKR